MSRIMRKTPLGRTGRGWWDCIRMAVKSTRQEGAEQINLAQDSDKWRDVGEDANEPSGFYEIL